MEVIACAGAHVARVLIDAEIEGQAGEVGDLYRNPCTCTKC